MLRIPRGYDGNGAIPSPSESREPEIYLLKRLNDFAENGHKNTELTALFAVPRGVKALPWQFECLRKLTVEANELLACLIKPGATSMAPSLRYFLQCIGTVETALADSKLFPSRLSLPDSAASELKSLFVKLYRGVTGLHRDFPSEFEAFEQKTSYCARLLAFGLHHSFMVLSSHRLPASVVALPAEVHSTGSKGTPSPSAPPKHRSRLSVGGEDRKGKSHLRRSSLEKPRGPRKSTSPIRDT